MVSHLSFSAKTNSNEMYGWNRYGEGTVAVIKNGNLLIFNETGTWQGEEGSEVNFTNVYRWTLDLAGGRVGLEHLRQGASYPVFLFDLIPSSNCTLSALDPHLCKKDTYFGKIDFDSTAICLNWRVIGPRKNEEMNYYYK